MGRPILPTALLLLGLAAAGCSSAPEVAGSTPKVRLVDRASEAGITVRLPEPSRRPGTILDTIGHGCAFLDYDADGKLDVLIAGSPTTLYHGDGLGNFTDVSEATGLLGMGGHCIGVAVGDANNDGFPDLYLSGWRTGFLLRNVGGRRFAKMDSGIPVQPWGTSAAWADYDRDGRLDLYIGNYVRFDSSSRALCESGGVQTSCPPGQYDGIPGRLYRNLGNFRFADRTGPAGLAGSPGKTLGVAWNDQDGDGWLDLALANDEVPGALYRNRSGRFKDIGAESGIAYSNVGRPHAGMGQDWGDFDGDGGQDLAVATFATEAKPVYVRGNEGLYVDQSLELGTGPDTIPLVAFGLKWLDVDNDGWLDLIFSNGHTSDNVEQTAKGGTYREPTVLFRSDRGRRLSRIHGADLDRPIVGRGLATGDYDNDGRVDVLVVDNDGRPLLLHNETVGTAHWLMVKLDGKKGRDATGARIRLSAGGRIREQRSHTDGSYLSASDPRVHFGLGTADSIDWIEVRWPSGRKARLEHPSIDRIVAIEEPR